MTSRADNAVDTCMPDDGGDPACWAHLVCPDCGQILTDAQAPVCEACGAARHDD